MQDTKDNLAGCFDTMATCYVFLSSKMNQPKVTLSTLQSMAKSRLNHLDLFLCSRIAPNLVQLEKDSVSITVPKISKRKRNVSEKLDLIKAAGQLFRSKLDEFFSKKTCNEELSRLKDQFESAIDELLPSQELIIDGIEDFLARYTKTKDWRSHVSSGLYWSLDAREALYKSIDLSEIVQAYLRSIGIRQLYGHQVESLELIRKKENVIVTTSTSSGKSLIYTIPILESLNEGKSTSLLLFPTKALAQDQFKRLVAANEFNTLLKCSLFDGDTDKTARIDIREQSNVLLTNPDMIHMALLPHFALWTDFLKSLKFVMIDEVHYYHNQMGGHLSHIMMRLKRICASLGNHDLQFIGCSATIPNAVEHFENLVGEPAKLVSKDCSPCERKMYALWLPVADRPFSLQDEATKIIITLIKSKIKTIVFAKTRAQCELLYKSITENLFANKLYESERRVISYRGGYSATERREIEQEIFGGAIMCVIATNALELGVDIGSLDAVVHVGFPASVSSYHQQSGRCGRRGRPSLDILVPNVDRYIDMIYVNDPTLLLAQNNTQHLNVDDMDETILGIHVNCAAKEIAISEQEELFFGENSKYEDACLNHLRHDVAKGVYIPLEKYNNNPAYLNPIREIPSNEFHLVDIETKLILESIAEDRVPFTIYQNAIHLHKGKAYLIVDVIHDKKLAKCRHIQVNYITKADKGSKYTPQKIDSKYRAPNLAELIIIGSLKKETIMYGYKKMNPRNFQVLEIIECNFKEHVECDVYGLWFQIPQNLINTWSVYNLNQAVHSVQHAIVALCPIYTSQSKDLHSACCSEKRSTALQQ